MSNRLYEFLETKKTFMSVFSGMKFPISYEQWNNLSSDLKAAALYVNFYDYITWTWCSFDKVSISDDYAVSVVIKYIMKNVSIVESDPARYSGAYFRTVAFNSILGAMRPKFNEYNILASNLIYDENTDDVIDLYDIIGKDDDPYEVIKAQEALWDIIAHMGPKAEKVANHLINGDSLKKTRKDSAGYADDRLRDVSVTATEYSAIVAQLKNSIAHLGYAFDI